MKTLCLRMYMWFLNCFALFLLYYFYGFMDHSTAINRVDATTRGTLNNYRNAIEVSVKNMGVYNHSVYSMLLSLYIRTIGMCDLIYLNNHFTSLIIIRNSLTKAPKYPWIVNDFFWIWFSFDSFQTENYAAKNVVKCTPVVISHSYMTKNWRKSNTKK